MESRKITIVSTKNQTKKVIMSSATTLAELKADLRQNGIDYQDMTFYEGTSKVELKTDNYRGTTEKDIEYYRAFCRINPIVFEEPNNLINKGIIKKLIPLYTSINIRFPQNGFTNNADSRKVEVIIDNFDKFFISPIKPTLSNNINETLNKCLNDNIEDILYF